MTMRKPSSDTAHLYDGKVVRSSAPSRKKIAGQAGIGSEIPKDAIPELEMPSFIESLIGGPIVPKMKFLPPDKFVQNMQLGVYVILVGLALLTYIISPPEGTIWFMLLGSADLALLFQIESSSVLLDLVSGVLTNVMRYMLGSYLLFILAIMRFASSKTSVNDLFGLADSPTVLASLVVIYSVLLIMYFELSNGVLRYSMLDTSIRTNEVYVMNPKKIVGKYHRSLIVNPIVATVLATLVLSANTILPWIVGILSEDTATRLSESVELGSVYGVALGTLFVFLVVGGLFALDLPTYIQKRREGNDE